MSADTPDFEIIPGECVVLEGVEYTFNALTLSRPTTITVTTEDIDNLIGHIDRACDYPYWDRDARLSENRSVVMAFLDKYGIAYEAVE